MKYKLGYTIFYKLNSQIRQIVNLTNFWKKEKGEKMLKNKKFLLMLAFSSLTASYAGQNNLENKYSNMYDKMTKNIVKGNSNDSY